MELVLLERALKALAVLEILDALSVEHSVSPVTFVLSFVGLPVKHTESRLNSIFKVALVAAAIAPPEYTPAVTFASFELSFVDI